MLPIEAQLPAIRAALHESASLVVHAPPGAGKTTLVPLALLDEDWLNGLRIVMLEPRRVAARAAARRMASLLGEHVGETVGFHVRLDRKIGSRTRIEVVTEGILTRRVQGDQALTDVGLLIFDEFHERSLQVDLGLALALDTQHVLRPDLRILVMSATLDATRVAALLGDAPVIASEGRQFPVETRYTPPPSRECRIARHGAAVVRDALRNENGSILVFLPGAGEIGQVASELRGSASQDTLIAPLHGTLSAADQDRAIAPAPPGMRKVVLATSIAETSLTIDGVSIVVDAGLMRVPRFDPNSAMTRLETVRVSRASAEQRRGRAGRLGPGVCYRLWSEAEDAALEAFTRPEILSSDLAPLALDLALWGVSDPQSLRWLDPPPPGAYCQALELLEQLDAVARDGSCVRVTEHGRAMATVGVHPRLAHMLRCALNNELGSLACDLAALLEERDILVNTDDCDIRARLDVLHSRSRWPGTATLQAHNSGSATTIHRGRLARVREQSHALHQRLRLKRTDCNPTVAGAVLARAYPDRIGRRRAGSGLSYLLANGRAVHFTAPSHVTQSVYVVVADLDGKAKSARVFMAAPLAAEDIESGFAAHIVENERVEWDTDRQRVVAQRERRYGALVLEQGALSSADANAVCTALIEGVRAMGINCLPWTPELRAWQQRVQFMHRLDPGSWPDMSDDALLDTLEEWLAGFVSGMRSAEDLKKVELGLALQSLLTHAQRRDLERLAPTHLDVPSGSRIRLDYAHDPPALPVKLQEMFGQLDTPRIAGGRVEVVVHLLSPAGRPVQITQDLRSFWQTGYQQVRKDLRGRYPKHPWPEDPLKAQPTRRTKGR